MTTALPNTNFGSTSVRVRMSVGHVLAFIDCSVIASYLIGVAPEEWHVATLVIKILLVLIFHNRKGMERHAAPALILFSLAVGSSFVFGRASYSPVLQYLGFMGHLGLSARLLNTSTIRDYVRTAAHIITSSALLYIILNSLGRIEKEWGRSLYFGNSHPNLGAEINAIGGFCAALTLRRGRFYVYMAILIAACALLQGRASLIALIGLGIFRYFFDNSKSYLSPGKIALVFITLIVATLTLALAQDWVFGKLSDLFMVHNQYRGIGTGASGRDAHWRSGIAVFLQYPFFGAGYGYFDLRPLQVPHNFFLYALAETGLFGFVAIVTPLIVYATRMARRSLHVLIAFLCMAPLLALNDRFFSIGPYPFMFFLLLICLSATGAIDIEPSRAVTRRPTAPVGANGHAPSTGSGL